MTGFASPVPSPALHLVQNLKTVCVYGGVSSPLPGHHASGGTIYVRATAA